MIWNGEFIAKAYVNCVIIWHSRVLLYVFSVFVTAVHGMLGAPSLLQNGPVVPGGNSL